MKKKIFILFCVGILTTSSLAKDFYIYPSIGYFNKYVNIGSVSTIDGYRYYNPYIEEQKKIINGDLTLLGEIDISDDINLAQKEIDAIEQQYNKNVAFINSLDIKNYIDGFITLGTWDAKTAAYMLWDLGIKEALTEKKLNNAFIDLTESIVKMAIDIAIEKYGVDSSLFRKYFTKILTESFEKTLGIYEMLITSSKLANNTIAAIKANENVKKQARYILKQNFIVAYVVKFKSNITKMAKYTKNLKNLKKTPNNFWDLFYWYSLSANPNLFRHITYTAGVYNSYELYQIAKETNDLINYYGINSIARAKIKEYIDTTHKYEKSYRFAISSFGNKTIDTRYYLPSSYDKTISYKHDDYNKFIFNGHIDLNKKIVGDTEEKIIKPENLIKKVKAISNIKYILTIMNKEGEEIDKQNYLYRGKFYIPAFFEDVKPNNIFMPYIADLFNKNIIDGYSNREFQPKNEVSIGEFIKMATRANFPNFSNTKLDTKDIFDFERYFKFLNNKGINTKLLHGTVVNSQSLVNQKATRDYVAKILTNILRKKEGKTQYTTCLNQQFPQDWDECSIYLKYRGIVSGYPKTKKFMPHKYITRDEIAKVISNTAKIHNNNIRTLKKGAVK